MSLDEFRVPTPGYDLADLNPFALFVAIIDTLPPTVKGPYTSAAAAFTAAERTCNFIDAFRQAFSEGSRPASRTDYVVVELLEDFDTAEVARDE